jgi:methyl-accepting chemotaxis protein
MDKVTQQNAAMAEQATAAGRSLAQESDQLTSLIGQFQVGNVSTLDRARTPAAKSARARAPVRAVAA